jgi:predicted RNA-binding Zn-ribbon protein involved in translation (DUF1610 family)
MAIPKSTRVVDHTMLRLVCPSCGRTLRLSRITSGTDSLPDQHTYSCQPCGVWVIESADDRVEEQDQDIGCVFSNLQHATTLSSA